MARASAGESELILDGKPYILKLTLGALADIEEEMQVETLQDLDKIFKNPSTKSVLATVSAMMAAGSDMPMKEARRILADQSHLDLGPMMKSMSAALSLGAGGSSKNPQEAAGT